MVINCYTCSKCLSIPSVPARCHLITHSLTTSRTSFSTKFSCSLFSFFTRLAANACNFLFRFVGGFWSEIRSGSVKNSCGRAVGTGCTKYGPELTAGFRETNQKPKGGIFSSAYGISKKSQGKLLHPGRHLDYSKLGILISRCDPFFPPCSLSNDRRMPPKWLPDTPKASCK